MATIGKVFPILTETACQKKWNWSSLYLTSGTTNSCHRCDFLEFDANNFDEFHNLPKKLNDRKLMLEGKWPSGGCEYCKDIELSGGISDRVYSKLLPNLTPPELLVNTHEIHVTPQILEVYMNSTCNLSCTYCKPNLSTKIQTENKKFGNFQQNGVSLLVHPDHTETQTQYFNKFVEWLPKNINNIKRLQIGGGEPFYQHELDVVLDILEKHPNKNLELNIISNMMSSKTQYYINKIKKLCKDRKISRLDLTSSIDCWGASAEYLRYGLNLKKWENNFSYAVKEKWIFLNVNLTITALSLRTTPELIHKINEYRKYKHINQEIGLVVGKDYMHPRIFGGEFWRKDFDLILDAIPESNHNEKNYFIGIWKYLSSCDKDATLISSLHTYLDELDRRRNTNWRTLFPYLNVV